MTRAVGALARVVVVAGSPRSGTTALFDALSTDPEVIPFHEPDDDVRPAGDRVDAIYRDGRLRPEVELRPHLVAAGGPVLLRGNEEVVHRTLDDLAREYEGHDLSIVWIYREPARVIGSAIARGWWEPTAGHIDAAVHEWVRRNEVALHTASEHLDVVSYGDLCAHPALVGALARRLGLTVGTTLGADLARGLDRLDHDQVAGIESATAATFAALERRRTLRPGPATVPPSPSRVAVVRSGSDDPGRPAARSVEPQTPDRLAGARLWLRPDDFDATSAPRRAIGGRVDGGEGEVVRLAPGLLEVVTSTRWRFMARAAWTLAVALHLPAGDEQTWSPVVTFGAPLLGRAGVSLTWLGADTDERPTAGPGELPPARTPGAGLLMVGIVDPRPHAITSARQAGLVVALEPEARLDARTVVIVTCRCEGPDRQLTMHLDGATTTVRGTEADETAAASTRGEPRPPPLADDDRLLIGGHPAGPPTPFVGVLRELAVIDRALDDGEVAGLAAHLRRP